MSSLRLRTLAAAVALATATVGALAACGGAGEAAGADGGPVTLRLGYFPNITHASAVVGVEKGIFQDKLGSNVTLETKTFNAGPAAVEALFSDAIDATYIGPNPTVNAHSKSNGEAVRVVSGSASGGVALVVKPEINGVEDLKGKKIATPQLGNTQDVAFRYWLKEKGLTATKEGGGDVSIVPQENAQTVETFASGAIQGAWVPEPFVSRLVNAGGKVLVDERDLWPDNKFVITNLIVSTKFLKAHPDVVKALVAGQVASNDYLHENEADSQKAISDHIGKITGKPLDLELIAQAWKTIEFTNDPIASSLATGLDHAVAVELTQPVDLKGLYDLSYLNEALKAAGEAEVPQP
ncbi:NitT/TauT family transport system substrate-binding protein [Catenuloplanes nepalensis]|uniref:NitT/TauT family transport system substrate-binding protein n=1 Tax=Catenuloplanes nepalensis TaxID=587533 RepID=A0ABT9N1V2_9ACTN|nr:ABC transporter substrate-binding protein [Catenuloplanes nepalensis]MDP9797668.1 NitT/TauT family transport system substrate-binding protein [Catenuloplanes nepalensis]